MSREVLDARLERREDGAWEVLAPKIGWWSAIPRPGEWLGPGSRIGTLEQLHRRWVLRLPASCAAGRAEDLPHARRVAVAYGQCLFRLLRSVELPRSAAESNAAASAGTLSITAPTDGVFYRRPAPDAAPFVEVGSRVRRGQPIGLVEVMKTFNQILYDGPGLPDEAEVVEIRCGDEAEVRAGQPLLLLR